MKKLIIFAGIAVMLVTGLVVSEPLPSFAESITWSKTFGGKSGSYWYRLPSIVSQGNLHTGSVFSSPHIEITYDATVKNSVTGEVITPGSCVPKGTSLTFAFTPHQSSHIYWFGTGYSNDSPYGDWRPNASAPPVACEEKDRVINEHEGEQYIPFVVHPPTKEVAGLSGLTCGTPKADGSVVCDTPTAGNYTPSFSFENTYGYFYWRQKNSSGACISQLDFSDGDWALSNEVASPRTSSTKVEVDPQSIVYPVCVTNANQPPVAPKVTVTALACPEYSIAMQSSDPANEQLRYGIDWDNNGTINEWVPASGYVNSGQSQTVTHSFRDGVAHTFKVYAQDKSGNLSSSTSQTVTVPDCATPPTVVLAADKTLLTEPNEGTYLRWQASANADSCTGTGFSTGGRISGSVYVTPAYRTTYSVLCVNSAGNATDSETVSVQPRVNACNAYARNIGRNTDFDASVILSKGPFYWEWSGSGDPVFAATTMGRDENDRTSRVSWYFQTPGVKSSQVRVRDAFGVWSDWKQCPDITVRTECSDGVDSVFDPEDTLADAADPGCHTDGNPSNPGSYDPSDNDEIDGATEPAIASCYASPNPINPGQSTTWYAGARGGKIPYTEYVWTGDDGLSGGGMSLSKTYQNAGTYTATVKVKDSAGIWSAPVTCQFPVTVAAQCNDRIDNDGDGHTDYNWGSGDPDCTDKDDNDEGGGSLTKPVAILEGRVIGSGNQWSGGTIAITPGDQVEVRWNPPPTDVSHISSCASMDFSTGNQKSGQSQNINEPTSGIDDVTLTCTGPGGQDADTLLIMVTPPPPPPGGGPSLDVTPTRVRRDGTVKVTADPGSYSDCTLSGVGIGSILLSGPYTNPTAGPIVGETEYTLACPSFNGGDPIRKVVRITETLEEQ